MKKYIIIIGLAGLAQGCATFNKIEHVPLTDDVYLIKQTTASDIICVRKKTHGTKKTQCVHVSGKIGE